MHAALTLVAVLAQADFYDQAKVPVEADAPGPGLAKIVLVAGVRRLVVNGILWTAKVDVPRGGRRSP